MDDGDAVENPSREKVNSGTCLLDSGEDFEVLDKDEIGDEPPPLEDTGGGKETVKMTSDADSDSQTQLEEWLDVLGIQHKLYSLS